MNANELSVGTKIYYTGDMANASGNFEVTSIETNRWGTQVTLKELDGKYSHNRLFRGIGLNQIDNKYKGHCGTRFVTQAARYIFRAMQLGNMAGARGAERAPSLDESLQELLTNVEAKDADLVKNAWHIGYGIGEAAKRA